MQGMCGAWRPSICTVTFISQSPSVCIFRFTVIAALCYRRSSSETVISLWQKKELSHWSEASLKSSYILSPPRILSHHNLDMTTNHDFYLPLNSLGDLSLIHHIFITAFWILTVRKMVLANNPHFGEIWGRMNEIMLVPMIFTEERHYVFKILFRIWMIYLSFSIAFTIPIGLYNFTTDL